MSIRPGTAEYQALSPFDKYDCASEWLAYEKDRERSEPSLARRAVINDLEGEVAFWRHVCIYDPVLGDRLWDIAHHCYIQPEGGALTLLSEMREGQRNLLTMLEEDRRLGQQGFYVVVKARKEGISTGVGDYFYCDSARFEGRNTLVLAHDSPSTEEIFRSIYRTACDNDPLQPKTEHSSKKEIVFRDTHSKISVRTAGGDEGLGRGQTLHNVHFSEASQYDQVKAPRIFNSVLNALARPPVHVAVVMEFTGYGRSGFAYETAKRAYEDPAKSPFKLVFIPWFRLSTCTLPFKQDADRMALVTTLDERELALMEKEKLSLEHINWYRWTYRFRIHASTENERRRAMMQEYPSDFWDAFQSSDTSVFDPDRLDVLRKHPRCHAALETATITAASKLWDDKQLRHVKTTPAPSVTKRKDGPLMIWKRPKPGHRYDIGVDLAKGRGRDWSVAAVLDRDTREFVALFRAQLRPTQMLAPVRLLSKWYNDGYIAPESTGFETYVEDLANTDRVDFLYMRQRKATAAEESWVMEYGQPMNFTVKGALVKSWEDALEREPSLFTMPILLDELTTFEAELDDSGHIKRYVGARGSNHDDVMIACGLALLCAKHMVRAEPEPADVAQTKETVGDRVRKMGEEAEDERGTPDYEAAMG